MSSYVFKSPEIEKTSSNNLRGTLTLDKLIFFFQWLILAPFENRYLASVPSLEAPVKRPDYSKYLFIREMCRSLEEIQPVRSFKSWTQPAI